MPPLSSPFPSAPSSASISSNRRQTTVEGAVLGTTQNKRQSGAIDGLSSQLNPGLSSQLNPGLSSQLNPANVTVPPAGMKQGFALPDPWLHPLSKQSIREVLPAMVPSVQREEESEAPRLDKGKSKAPGQGEGRTARQDLGQDVRLNKRKADQVSAIQSSPRKKSAARKKEERLHDEAMKTVPGKDQVERNRMFTRRIQPLIRKAIELGQSSGAYTFVASWRADLPGRSEKSPVWWASPNIHDLAGDVPGSLLSHFTQIVQLGVQRKQRDQAALNAQVLMSIRSVLNSASGSTAAEQVESAKQILRLAVEPRQHDIAGPSGAGQPSRALPADDGLVVRQDEEGSEQEDGEESAEDD